MTLGRPEAVDLRIRAARPSDAAALGPLIAQLPDAPRDPGRIGADGSRSLLVERGGRVIVAFGVVDGVGAPRAVVAVAVADDHRRHGLAGVLVERLAALAWAEGTRRVAVHTAVAGADLRALLRRRCARR